MSENSSSKIFTIIKYLFFSSILIGLIIFGFGYNYYNSHLNKPLSLQSKLISVTVPEGTTKIKLIDILNEQGLKIDKNIAKLYYRFNDPELEAGVYNLDLNTMNLKVLLNSFNNGQFTEKAQFIEGWRLTEYIEYLEQNFGVDFAKEFLDSPYFKEGYLYPDTYIISTNWTGDQLAELLHETFETKTIELKKQAETKGMKWDDVVILASILEREINIKEDKPIVAGIYWRRLNTPGWRLQTDATIQYAKGNYGNWWPQVTRDDYSDFNSSYNTYLVDGLPPTPISNPSVETINAIINYEDSEYWYYISDSQGITRFAKNLAAHNSNIDVYLR